MRGSTHACLLSLFLAVACTNAGSVGDERGDLGRACTSSADCGGGLTCDTSEPLFGLCTRSCSSTDDCQLEYGLGSFCIGANRCVRECVRDTDCLERTACDTEFSWCK